MEKLMGICLIFVQNEWVICRVFQKTAGGKKIHISGIMRSGLVPGFDNQDELVAPSLLPPLMDSSSSPYNGASSKPPSAAAALPESGHVHCFSNSSNPITQKSPEDMFMNYFINNSPNFPNHSMEAFSRAGWGQIPGQIPGNYQFPGQIQVQDPSILRALLENCGQSMMMKQEFQSVSQETGLSTDINTENSSAVSNMEMGGGGGGRRSSCVEDQAGSVGVQDLDILWNY